MMDINTNFVKEVYDLREIAVRNDVFDEYLIRKSEKLLKHNSFKHRKLDIHEFELSVRNRIINKYRKNIYKSPYFIDYEDHENYFSDYDRANPLELAERKLSVISKDPKLTMAFRSGMTAISCILDSLPLIKNLGRNFITYADYFETQSLLKIKCLKKFNLLEADTTEALKNYLSDNDNKLFFVELPKYSGKEGLYTIKEILSFIKKNRDKQILMIVDNTLYSLSEDIKKILENFPFPITLIFVRSGLKLDQYGLELMNLGIVNVFSNLDNTFIDNLRGILKLIRTVTGGSLSNTNYHILSSNFLDSKRIDLYKKKIISNTSYIANSIDNNEMITVHYSEGHPFFYITFNISNYSIKNFFKKIEMFYKKNNSSIHYGTSFGFRQTRYELINKTFEFGLVNTDNPFLRISPGYYLSDSDLYLIEFFNDIIMI